MFSSVQIQLFFSLTVTQPTECIQLFPQPETQETEQIPQQEPHAFSKPVPLQQIQVPVLLQVQVPLSQDQEDQGALSFQV